MGTPKGGVFMLQKEYGLKKKRLKHIEYFIAYCNEKGIPKNLDSGLAKRIKGNARKKKWVGVFPHLPSQATNRNVYKTKRFS